jgi:hypothetical protein
MKPIRIAQEGMGPTEGYSREEEKFDRRTDKENRLLMKYLKKQAKKTGKSESELLLETLQNMEGFEGFKEKRKMLGGLAGMAGLGLASQVIPAVARMRKRRPGGFTPQGASTHQTNLIERLFPGLFGLDG